MPGWLKIQLLLTCINRKKGKAGALFRAAGGQDTLRYKKGGGERPSKKLAVAGSRLGCKPEHFKINLGGKSFQGEGGLKKHTNNWRAGKKKSDQREKY